MVLRRGGKNTQKNYTKNLHDPDNHDGVITHLEPDILECEVKWALRSITTNKASGSAGIPVELFQILKDDNVKVLHSICQQISKTHHLSQDWNRSVFIPMKLLSQQPHGLQPSRLLHPWDFPGKSTGVGCHCLLQIPKKGNAKECSNHCTIALTHMLAK